MVMEYIEKNVQNGEEEEEEEEAQNKSDSEESNFEPVSSVLVVRTHLARPNKSSR